MRSSCVCETPSLEVATRRRSSRRQLGAVGLINRTGFLRPVLYGWVDELLRLKPTKAHVFTAFVLTDTEQDGMLLGYEGALLNLRQSPSGEVRVVG
ncbi:hypothetical protein D3C77_282510 [compost metagenome]